MSKMRVGMRLCKYALATRENACVKELMAANNILVLLMGSRKHLLITMYMCRNSCIDYIYTYVFTYTYLYTYTHTPNSLQVDCRTASYKILLRIFLSVLVLTCLPAILGRNSVSLLVGIFNLAVKSPSIPTSAQGHYIPFLAEEGK